MDETTCSLCNKHDDDCRVCKGHGEGWPICPACHAERDFTIGACWSCEEDDRDTAMHDAAEERYYEGREV